MRLIRNSFRWFTVSIMSICLSCLMLFTVVTPAYSATLGALSPRQGSSSPSLPTQGEEQLKKIEKKSEDYLKPENTFSPDKIREESNKGLNEVQGDADIDKMKNPANSAGADSVENQLERTLGKIRRNS
jgi:hypothetical protein